MMNKEKSIINLNIRNIVILGLISFFADIASEMVYPIIPLYLTAVFGATPTLVGIIEGIAESIASLLKVFSGFISDKYKHKKPIAFSGYATGLFYKIALLFAGSWAGVLFARVIDRLGKGIRTAPRDVMVSENADKNNMGKAFGIHKSLDMAGSAIGILIAFFLLKNIGNSGYKTIFAYSIIPIILALFTFMFVKEKKNNIEVKKREKFWENTKKLDKNLKLYLLVVFLFTLGNSSNAFLLLRAYDVGFSSTNIILLYFIYNITAAVFAIPFGKRSDKIGRKKILVLGYIAFSLVYMLFAFAISKPMMVIAFVIYGLYTAMVTSVERAYISEIAPPYLKGTMLGLHSTLIGIALLPASIIAGLLWDNIGGFAPFMFGAGIAIIAASILQIGIKTSIKN